MPDDGIVTSAEGVRPARVLFAALVLAFAVRSVMRRLGQGRGAWVGACSALGTAAVVTRRQGDALTPVITWSLVVLVVDMTYLPSSVGGRSSGVALEREPERRLVTNRRQRGIRH